MYVTAFFFFFQLVCSKANSLEALKEKSEHELGTMLGENNTRHEEELRRLCRALHNLRRYMGKLLIVHMSRIH